MAGPVMFNWVFKTMVDPGHHSKPGLQHGASHGVYSALPFSHKFCNCLFTAECKSMAYTYYTTLLPYFPSVENSSMILKMQCLLSKTDPMVKPIVTIKAAK